jgi:hypothetical protein
MLSSLLEGILLQLRLGLNQAGVDFLQISSATVDITLESLIFFFQLFILISLLRVEIIELALISHVDILNLRFNV